MRLWHFIFMICAMNTNILVAQLKVPMQKLKISDSQRFLVKEDGSPFVWIGETNWFFARLSPSIIDSILDKRSRQGYSIMFVSCRENLYNGSDPGDIKQPNETWWEYLDQYIEKCRQRNMYVGITLGWYGLARKHSPDELFEYGKWVGNRYKHKNNIVWLTLGETGSHLRKSAIKKEKITALINGIRTGDTGNKLLTIHADYKRGSSITDDGELCDFNNWQTSQWCCPDNLPRKDKRNWRVWEAIEFDYNKKYNGLNKPTLDSEAWYENNKDFCGTTPFIIRRRAYYSIFAGGFGFTYGAGGIWDGRKSGEKCSGSALQAIHYPGARDVGYLSQFLNRLDNEFLKLRPNQELIVEGNSESYDSHIQSTMAHDGSFALVYSGGDGPYSIDLSRFTNGIVEFCWYNPREDFYTKRGEILRPDNPRQYKVDPPGEEGPGNDWILMVGNSHVLRKMVKD